MREKRKNILEYELKKNLFLASLTILLPIIIKKTARIKKESLLYIAHKDNIDQIKAFKDTNEITYPLGFFFCLTMGPEYSSLLEDKELLESTLLEVRKEDRWDSGNISYEMAIFFSYTFMNELYKDISIDIHLLSKEDNPLPFFKELRKELLNL
jgi:hypothetical protein